MDKNIPTAEEFVRKEYESYDGETSVINCEGHHAIWMMQEFAKLHVTAALNAAAKNAGTTLVYHDPFIPARIQVDKESILNAYPLDNIK